MDIDVVRTSIGDMIVDTVYLISEHQFLFTLLFAIIVSIIVRLILRRYLTHLSTKCSTTLTSSRRVLLVTAHPDDETMFFGPTIRTLVRSDRDIYVLCLSSGGYIKGQSFTRKKELRSACEHLGIPARNVTVVEHPHLRDDPTWIWPKQLVCEIVQKYAWQFGVDTVVTFDEWGVSLHPNHRAIYYAAQSLYARKKLPRHTRVLVLDSVILCRKYMGVLDVCLSRLVSRLCVVAAAQDVQLIRSAMSTCHVSQMVWFRRLYMKFSRYVYVNTLRDVGVNRFGWGVETYR